MPIKMRLDDEGERAESSCRLGVGINVVDAPQAQRLYAVVIIVLRCIISVSASYGLLSMMPAHWGLTQVS